MTEHGISISDIYGYVIYYGIVILFFVPAMVHGKRANCHYICWMAPFMIFGYKVGRFLHLPQLKIKAQKENCVGCKKCEKVCPMSLNVSQLLQKGEIKSAECILFGECAKACAQNVLNYNFTNKR